MRLTLLLSFIAGPAFADICPTAPDHAAQQAAIYDQLQALPSPVGARELSDQLWRLWTDAPDEAAQALLDQGMRQRESFNLLGARDTLDQLIEYCPDYAEGYNQRAFANFLDANYTGALVDLDVALTITPTHMGAMTGKVLTLLRLERNDEAQALLREALALNPWLAERALLVEPEGEDI
jgi:tetratricopeptide (TPR) repeat protein